MKDDEQGYGKPFIICGKPAEDGTCQLPQGHAGVCIAVEVPPERSLRERICYRIAGLTLALAYLLLGLSMIALGLDMKLKRPPDGAADSLRFFSYLSKTLQAATDAFEET